MIIDTGEKVHVAYRALFEGSNRRHFLGEVITAEGTICRLRGYAFVYDQKSTMFIKKQELRTTIVDLAESGYVVNMIDRDVQIVDVVYKYEQGVGLIATDGKGFSLNINEFGARS